MSDAIESALYNSSRVVIIFSIAESHLPLAILTDSTGTIIEKTSAIPASLYPWLSHVSDNLPSIYSGLSDMETFGIDRELPLTEGPKGLAMRVSNGIVILFAPEPTIREREELTVGKLIGRLGENPRVRYITLQDESGFIFATKSVREMTSLVADSFLIEVRANKEPNWRYLDFSGERVFELAMEFPPMGSYRGVLRVGLSTSDYDHLLRGYAVQLGIILLLVLLVAVAATGLLLATRRLAAERGLSDAILSGMSAACVAVDKEETVTLVNPIAGRLFNISHKRVLGEKLEKVIPDDPLELKTVLEKGIGESFQLEIEKGGERYVFDVSTGLLPDGGAFAVAEDISDLVELRKEVAGAEHLRALGELAAGVAHEIRNPLNSIGIAAQRLAVEFEPEKDVQAYRDLLSALRGEIDRLDRVIQEFIGLSAPMAPDMRTQPLAPLLEEVSAAGKLHAEGAKVHFETEISDIGKLDFDSEHLKKALLNLIKNAVEATPPNGHVRLTAVRSSEDVEISIWDDGPPIPEKVMEKLGKPFVSAGKEGGTGIGLFVAYRVVRDHGGDIEVETGESGTTFTVILPGRRK